MEAVIEDNLPESVRGVLDEQGDADD